MTRGGLAWVGLAGLLGGFALSAWAVPHGAIDWQPRYALSQPWRAFTAAGVHFSAQHLVANLGGVLLTGGFGFIAQVPARLAWAWFVAWPLTQFGLLIEPALVHFGGLSGVLHAGFTIVVTFLLVRGTGMQRGVAVAVSIGLVAKLLNEAPWGAALRYPAGWDIAIAPLAHTTGAVAGAACALIALHLPRNAGSTTPPA